MSISYQSEAQPNKFIDDKSANEAENSLLNRDINQNESGIQANAYHAASDTYSMLFQKLEPINKLDHQSVLDYTMAINQLTRMYPGIENLFNHTKPTIEIKMEVYNKIDSRAIECLNNEKHIFFASFINQLSKSIYNKVLFCDIDTYPTYCNNLQVMNDYLETIKGRHRNRIFEEIFDTLDDNISFFKKDGGKLGDYEMNIKNKKLKYDPSTIKFLDKLELPYLIGNYKYLCSQGLNKAIFFDVLSEYYLVYYKDKNTILSRDEFLIRISEHIDYTPLPIFKSDKLNFRDDLNLNTRRESNKKRWKKRLENKN